VILRSPLAHWLATGEAHSGNSEEDFLIWQNAQTLHTPEFPMKQMTFADAEYAGKRKQTRKELFLIEMDRVVPWKGLIALIEPHYPKGEGGRPAYPLIGMLRVHLTQNWFGYSDPAMEAALYETTFLRQFAGLSLERVPDATTILNFRRLLEKHELAAGILGVINGYLGDRGLSLRQGTSSMPR